MKTHKTEVINMKHNNNQETRIALLEQSNLNINETLKDIKQGLIRLENKIDSLDKKMESKIDSLDKRIDIKINSVDQKLDIGFDKINSRIWSLFLWGVGAFAAVLGLIAHAEKWI